MLGMELKNKKRIGVKPDWTTIHALPREKEDAETIKWCDENTIKTIIISLTHRVKAADACKAHVNIFFSFVQKQKCS
jgi:hypothetical protein